MSDLDNQITGFADRFARAAQQIIYHELVQAAPVDTGELRDSIRVSAFPSSAAVRILAEATAPQANWTELGTRAHIIPTGGAAAGRLLAFYWKRKSVFVVTREVHHPGTKPQRWFSRTLFHWQAMATEAARRAAQ